MPPSWHPVPACVRNGILQAKPFSIAATENRIGRGPRCRYGHCRRAIPHCSSEDAASILKSGLEIKNRCTQEGINRQNLASIPKSEPEIKNRCTQEGLNGEKLTSIRKFGLEIKNRCTKEGLNREKLASIPKSGLKIKNRCTQEGLNREILASIPKSGPEIKNRCRPGLRRRNHFPLRQRKLESDAADRRRNEN